MNSVGLYIHIPFCQAKCHYCDFATYVGKDNQHGLYLEALEKEMSRYQGLRVNTLFVGGGTPTVLSSQEIHRLFTSLRRHFDLSSCEEATVEANPESSTESVLTAYRDQGINRVSFGFQSADNRLLAELGRLHDRDRFLKAYGLARQLGFRNINIDLMFGLPHQTLQNWEDTLTTVLGLESEHISLYALKVEPSTKLNNQGYAVDDDVEADMYLAGVEKLKKAGYHHYEISNMAKPGKECQHNLKYWKNQDTVGIGLSAASFYQGHRSKNTTDWDTYLRSLQNGQSPVKEDEQLPDDKSFKENVMLSLRLSQGIPWPVIQRLKEPLFDRFLKEKLAIIEKGRYCLTSQGWLLSNQLFQCLV